ncbi:MAG TPA: LytTR family DNA-binding domain-containing protein [Chryseosolibacter sp.]|nr:LytTR family DNA-binding domain-containing protein [Chryseosolibacter sp.]
MIFTALIIDDIENSRISLAHDLKTYCPQVHVIGQADGVKTGVTAIREKKPDVVFLDIEMGDGTGFDVLEQVRDVRFQVIFTTGLDSYGIKAIKFSALDYLLKPVDPDELVNAVAKLEANAKAEHASHGVELLLQNLKNNLKPTEKRIALHSADKVHLVFVSDIVRCESQGAYTLFHLQHGRQVLATKNLREFEILLDDHGFIRVHHSHLINFAHMKEYVKKDGGYAVMSDGSQIPVSTRKRSDLLNLIGD